MEDQLEEDRLEDMIHNIGVEAFAQAYDVNPICTKVYLRSLRLEPCMTT